MPGGKMENRRTDDDSPVAQVRIARPTDRLAEVVSFYRDALGLEQIASFEGHAGYEGVMLALPGRRDHLEFTHHQSGTPCPAPTKDNLLVFYVEDEGAFRKMVARLRRHGHEAIEPKNPYWAEEGLTFGDPDGWRVVLMHAGGI
jgi:catechol 2,3-dioxygenase-like lactoylglutathione lyase family enzyme